MAENPYQDPRFAEFGNQADPGPTRTSKLAVASLILGIVSPLGCVAGVVLSFAAAAAGGGAASAGGLLIPLAIATAVLGLVLGAVALLLIYARPQLSGAGYAIGGIIINMVTLGLLVVTIVIVNKFSGMMVGDGANLLTALEAGDADAARQLMDPGVRDQLTDERVAAFGDELSARMGAAQALPDSLFDLFSPGVWTDPAMQRQFESFQSMAEEKRLVAFPLPVQFERGEAMILVFADDGGLDDASLAGDIVNMVAITPQGDPIWLLPPPPGDAESAPAPLDQSDGNDAGAPPPEPGG